MFGFFSWAMNEAARKDLSKLPTFSFVKQKAVWGDTPKFRYWFVFNSPFKYIGTCVNLDGLGTKECAVFNQYRLLVQPQPLKVRSERIVTPI